MPGPTPVYGIVKSSGRIHRGFLEEGNPEVFWNESCNLDDAKHRDPDGIDIVEAEPDREVTDQLGDRIKAEHLKICRRCLSG